MNRFIAAALAALLMSGAAAPPGAGEAPRMEGLRMEGPRIEGPRIEGAWVRAMPPGQRVTAAYMRIVAGKEAVRVRGAFSPIGEAELHETQTIDGRARMRELDALELAAGASLTLAPGGRHIMLMGLAQTPREGDLVRLCLDTDRGTICTEASVRRAPVSGAGPADRDPPPY